MHSPSAATTSPDPLDSPDPLAGACAVFLPGEPAREGRVALWHPAGTPVPHPSLAPRTPAAPDASGVPDTTTAPTAGAAGTLTVVGEDLRPRTVPALLLAVPEALPLLTRARIAPDASPSLAFWGAAAVLALHFTARGLLLPGLTAQDHDSWRMGPLSAEDLEGIRALAAAMPPAAHAVPLETGAGAPVPGVPLLPEPERLLRSFLDAVADVLPRTPAAATAAGGPAFAATELRPRPELRAWAADIAAAHDAAVRISLRLELTEDPFTSAGGETAAEPGFRAVLQMHSADDPTTVADAADVWADGDGHHGAFGPRARMDALLALRRAVRAWPALTPLLREAVPDALDLADEDVAELLGGAAETLAACGVALHWPKELSDRLTARVVVGLPGDHPAPGAEPAAGDSGVGGSGSGGSSSLSSLPSLLGAGAPFALRRHLALGDRPLTRQELDRLAETKRPLVRLRDQWVLVDPDEVRFAQDPADGGISAADALHAALTGTVELDGRPVQAEAAGALARLRDRIADPEDGSGAAQPAALAATLRDYQLRGLNWLDRMTGWGLGGCLADDMGLGKTITLIALHLRRQEEESTAGPTLVVCPTSLLGNWQREIERFAPGTPVVRFHGSSRNLDRPADGSFVLTTYGTMRLDAERLGRTTWGLVVADEAQHVKNPYSATARQLRTLPAKARVALTGTPVENNLSELWAILDWTTPGLLGRLGTFRRHVAQAAEGGDPAAARRLAALVRPFLLRRRKSDPGIAPELPPKTETDRAVALTPEQAGLYEAVVRETLEAISGAHGMERRGLVVRLLTSLKQICNHPAQYLKEESPVLGGRSGKLELLDELLDTILAEGASVLVFTQYVQMARLVERHLAARGIGTQLLHGGTPVAGREAMVARFQRGEVPVFLLSLKAAGTGLNLTRAEHVVHLDRWWNPAVEAQATDRAYRIGQTRPVQVHRLIAEGTVEDRIAALLARKQELADAVLGSGEAALTELSDAELAELVELREDGGRR
ncbi:DEAD/DEAH box helicase [Streptomyces yaizuensis]|uniref:DEAD/DEAH box helicase n=1 Tax=Streptomyces yaizuensis TaxID=2989713 RepID=A0ABQ5NSG7_9ACTN|nr:DEAD/DEAH box helicase [Streptomyces sp. YSPA8]GLF93304.1 DEAD/DEAH box helicase [Streptomyces sp. YSPA8]